MFKTCHVPSVSLAAFNISQILVTPVKLTIDPLAIHYYNLICIVFAPNNDTWKMKIMIKNHIMETKENLHFMLLWQVWVDSVAPFWSDQICSNIILSRPCEILNLPICFDHGNINQAKRRRGSSDGAVMYEERCPIAPWREGLSRWLCTSFVAARGGSNAKAHHGQTLNNFQLPDFFCSFQSSSKPHKVQNQRMCLLFCPTLSRALTRPSSLSYAEILLQITPAGSRVHEVCSLYCK